MKNATWNSFNDFDLPTYVTSPLVTIMNTSSSVGSFSAKLSEAAVGGD